MRLRFMPRSLAGQLVALLLGALVLAQMLTTVFFVENRRAGIEAATREQILSRTAALVRLVEDTPPAFHARILETAGTPRLRYDILPTPLIASPGLHDLDTFAASNLAEIFGDGREIRAEVGEREWRPLRHHDDERESGPRARQTDDDAGPGEARRGFRPVTVALSVRLADGRWLNAQTILLSPALFAWPTIMSTLLIGGAIVLVLAFTIRRVTRPLRRLSDAADRLGRGETVPDLPEEGPEEVRRSTHAFNLMQGRVRRFVTDRTRMLAAVSHDLRTPLTTLRLRAEFVDDQEIRDKIIATVDEMNRMTEATLAFARDDAGNEASRPTDLAALVRAVADDFADLGEDVTVEAPDKLDHMVRPVALRRALRNLVENAIRYGTRARIRLVEADGEVTMVVEDDGPGIPEGKLEEVFEPFTRLETSRSSETGGVGLGLATARSIVRAHGGELTLMNGAKGGLVATVRLPTKS
jgi:signal transduction histidine kinase